MTDRAALPDQRNDRTTPDGGTTGNDPRGTKNGTGEGHLDPRLDSFDARFAALTDGFGEACEREGVTTAIAIAIHPEEKNPIIFIRGHQYDVSVVLTDVQRYLVRKLLAPFNPSYEQGEEEADDRE